MRSVLPTVVCLAVAAALPSAANADPIQAVPTVAMGTDYFATFPATAFYYGPSIGVVSFVGTPIGPGQSDTIIQRQADATINGAPIPISMTALSMQSVAPVTISGTDSNVTVALDPAHLAQNTGTMQINGGLSGGWFSSSLNADLLSTFTPVGGGAPLVIPTTTVLGLDNNPWSPIAPLNAALVPGPDDGSIGDQAANLHSGLDANEVDFFASPSELQPGGNGIQRLTSAGNTVVPLDETATVYSGNPGLLTFLAYNPGPDATITGINATAGATFGDPTDAAAQAAVLGGNCPIGGVLASGAACFITLPFGTNTSEAGSPLFGVTPFTLTVSFDDGRVGSAVADAWVLDPEPGDLAPLLPGLGALALLQCRSRRRAR